MGGIILKQTIQEYLLGLSGKRIAVVGLGISNRPLVRLLLQAGLPVLACDKTPREKLDQAALDLEAQGATLRLGPDYLENLDADVIFRTPGLHPDTPGLKAAVERGAELTSEMEAFFRVCPCPILAVTGSDGKTTTTTLIAKLLEQAGKTVWLGGNIGHPLLAEAEKIRPDDVAVLELSSFQLLTMDQSPQVALVTNLAPNHLDIHKDMDEYVTAKKNIFLAQGPADRLVLNLDNEITRGFAVEARGQVSWFSRQTRPDRGVYLRGSAICRVTQAGEQAVLDRSDLLLPGDHNVENFMAAMAAVEGLVPDEAILEVAKTFAGVAHRIERIRVKDGVTWYNDSIASSPSRTIAGLKSFEKPVILIAGGYDKHIPYDVLGPEMLAHVKRLILTGDTAPKIRAALEQTPGYHGQIPIHDVQDLAAAVKLADETASAGDVVILSPASASFDHFKNFEQRGNVFRQLVLDL